MSAGVAANANSSYGPMGRLGAWVATNRKIVFGAWIALLLVMGFFAPRVEQALSGAGWEASGSESIEAREQIDADFDGASSYALQVVVHSGSETISDPEFRSTVAAVTGELSDHPDVSGVIGPADGGAVSADRHTVVVEGLAGADPTTMVEAAREMGEPLADLGGEGTTVALTGASGMWSDFNDANKEAMLKSELISWPVTLTVLVLAFGSLVAAGLPLMLTILGLMAAAGSLFLASQLLDISIWAMNFALMFALALGIDYALFIVFRFRQALFGEGMDVVEATATSMETAGKAVLFSGITVLVSLAAVLLVPSPAFRSMSLGIMLSVFFVLAASLTLLPAVLAKLGPRLNKGSLPWARGDGEASKRYRAWGERLWKRPLAHGIPALLVLAALAIPVLSLETGMPSITVVPEDDPSRVGYGLIQDAFGKGAPGTLQIVGPATQIREAETEVITDPGIAVIPEIRERGDQALMTAVPSSGPSSEETGATIERLRAAVADGVLIGGGAAENHDLEQTLGEKTPLVIGVVLLLGFMLLLVVVQAPLVAALGVVTNLLAVGAAFGIGSLIFQHGNLEGLLGFTSQGFVDAWAPIFFFAMVFAISMDYTVFLLSTAREEWERSGDPREAMIGGLAQSGRVISAAGVVMVAVFFTFALSGPLPPKEMGIILGVSVLLDAALVRLLVVPVLMRLMGGAAWKLPRWLGRILPNVSFNH